MDLIEYTFSKRRDGKMQPVEWHDICISVDLESSNSLTLPPMCAFPGGASTSCDFSSAELECVLLLDTASELNGKFVGHYAGLDATQSSNKFRVSIP